MTSRPRKNSSGKPPSKNKPKKRAQASRPEVNQSTRDSWADLNAFDGINIEIKDDSGLSDQKNVIDRTSKTRAIRPNENDAEVDVSRHENAFNPIAEIPLGFQTGSPLIFHRDQENLDFQHEETQSRTSRSTRRSPQQETLVDQLTPELDPPFYDDLHSAVLALKTVTDDVSVALSKNRDLTELSDEYVDSLCKEYARATRSFAAFLIGERIRRSFQKTICGEGKSTESAEEKKAHAREFREWMAAFDLGISHEGKLLQITGKTDGTSGGIYKFTEHGNSNGKPVFVKWADAKSLLSKPTLNDVSRYLRRRIGHSLER